MCWYVLTVFDSWHYITEMVIVSVKDCICMKLNSQKVFKTYLKQSTFFKWPRSVCRMPQWCNGLLLTRAKLLSKYMHCVLNRQYSFSLGLFKPVGLMLHRLNNYIFIPKIVANVSKKQSPLTDEIGLLALSPLIGMNRLHIISYHYDNLWSLFPKCLYFPCLLVAAKHASRPKLYIHRSKEYFFFYQVGPKQLADLIKLTFDS